MGGRPRGPDRRPRGRAPPNTRRIRRRPDLSSAPITDFTLKPKGPFTLASAARIVSLDREPLPAKDPNVAYAELRELPGIGPFSAGLNLTRAVGTTDVAPKGEPRLEQAVEARYGRPLADVVDTWRPFRTWTSVLMRANA